MLKLNKLLLAMVTIGVVSGCHHQDEGDSRPTLPDIEKAQTAPSQAVVIQEGYKATDVRYAYEKEESAEWEHMSQEYQSRVTTYNEIAHQYPQSNEDSYPGFDELPSFIEGETYDQTATLVIFTDGQRYGVFSNKWWTQGNVPSFDDKSGPWTLVAETDSNGRYLTELDSVKEWRIDSTYLIDDKVKYRIGDVEYWFRARYWTKGDTPALTKEDGGDLEKWETPWEKTQAPEEGDKPDPSKPEHGLPILPPCEGDDCKLPEDPNIPPVIPGPPEEPLIDPEPAPKPEPGPGDDVLPAEGYAFLRDLTKENWDWFFPMRSGRYNESGDARNRPPFANPDGSTDVFTLKAFKEAVVEYNAWAAQHNYKQFLNEGSKSQQALEFASFWGKASRETSGTWANAPEPWITKDNDGQDVWKGALYWVEEVGYSTNPDGTSPTINYVDAASNYKPVSGRSYYGRGVIQLSWNYNYGAFSEWLYNNGMLADLIKDKDTLLIRPDYVATNGELSILSGIWFWMTPQEAKPSAHDVMYGDMTHVSESSRDQGLPQRNDSGSVPTEEGESYDEAVIAYRLGTVTNIVNGGLECNGAASWHLGPVQRVSYYNAYAKYLNTIMVDISVPLITDAENVWTTSVTENSPENLKTSSCFVQKAYYGW